MRNLDKNSSRANTNSIYYYVLVVYSIILPWPHGGEIVWQYLLCSTVIFVLFTVLLFRNIDNPIYVSPKLKLPLYLLSSWLIYHIVQLVTLPEYLLSTIGVNTSEPFYSQRSSISVSPINTFVALIKHSSYILTFVIAYILLDSSQKIIGMAKALFWSSALISIYSLVNHYTNGQFDLVYSIPPWVISWEVATHGTFSYQNHYASFLMLTIPLGFGLLFNDKKKKLKSSKTAGFFESLAPIMTSKNIVYIVTITLMYLSLLKTSSRGGNAIFLIAVLVSLLHWLCALDLSKFERIKKLLKIGIGLTCLLAFFLLSGIADSLEKRLKNEGFDTNGRTLIHQTALETSKSNILWGSGANTYALVQHKYKTPLLGNTEMSKRAHNDYLELFSNQGVIGFSMFSFAILILYRMMQKSVLDRGNGNATSKLQVLQTACFCSVTSILLHAVVDFSFQLPVNAVYFFILLAIGLRSYHLKSELR